MNMQSIFGFTPMYVEFDFLLNGVNFYTDNYANIYLTPKNETKIIW